METILEQIKNSLRSKVEFANQVLSDLTRAVYPGANDEPLIQPTVLCFALRLDALETPKLTPQKNIKPGSQAHDWYVHLVKMPGEAGGPPIRPILRVSEIGKIPVGYPFQKEGKRRGGEMAIPLFLVLCGLLQASLLCCQF